ncbi:hypothetical protein ACP4OV_001618 [Aristida adscensionis]
MEPPAAAASPDPAPQDHSPAPSPAKRSAWKHPAPNGVADPPAPGAGLIGAIHWPALSETAKGAKLAPAPAPAPVPGPGPDSSRPPDSSPGPVASSPVANPSNSQKHSSGTHHGRHKPARRGGGVGGGDHSPRDHHPDRNTGGGWDHGGGGRGGQRNHNNGGGGRRGNGSGGSGGGVSHHGGGGGGGGGGFGGRRRGGFDGYYRGPHPMGMGYMRGAPPPPPPPPMPVAAPFMGHPPPPVSPMRGFAGPMLFHEMPSPVSPVSPMYYFTHPHPEALRGMPFPPPMVGPPAYPYFQALHEPQPAPDAEPEHEPELDSQTKHAELMKQIEFYFSKDNLCGDIYLRQQMDDQGWVDISVIAGFNKVRKLTDDVQCVKEIVQSLPMLEMQGDKVRTRDDWNIWVIPRSSNRDTTSSSFSAPSHNVNNLTAHLGGLGLHESASSSSTVDQHHHEGLENGSPSLSDQAPSVDDNSGEH